MSNATGGTIVNGSLESFCKTYPNNAGRGDFSLCFEDTIISWILCGAVLVISLGYTLLSQRSMYNYSNKSILFILTLLAGGLSVVPHIIIVATLSSFPVLIINAVAVIATTTIVMLVMVQERYKGNTSIFPVWTFWFSMTLLSLIKLRSMILHWENLTNIDDYLPTLFIVHFGACLINLLLNSVAELPNELTSRARPNANGVTPLSQTPSSEKFDKEEIIFALMANDKDLTKLDQNKTQIDPNRTKQNKLELNVIASKLVAIDESGQLIKPKPIEMDECESKMKYDKSIDEDRKANPVEWCSFPSYVTFHWLSGTVWKGFKAPLEDRHLFTLPVMSKTTNIIRNFFISWVNTEPCPKGGTACQSDRGIEWSLVRCNWRGILSAVILKLAQDMLQFIPPQILEALILYNINKDKNNEEGSTDAVEGYVYVALLVGCMLLQTICLAQYFDNSIAVGMRIRVALVAAIYRKALRLNNAGQKSSQLGQMINLMQVDAQKFQDMMTYVNMIWSAPLQILLSMVLLWKQLGPSTLVGLSVTIVFLPLNSVLMSKLQIIQRKIMGVTDERVRKTDEVLNGMKVIKFFGWETKMMEFVEAIRGRELGLMKSRVKYSVVMTFIWSCSPILVSLLSFLCYSLLGNQLTSEKAFVSLALFNILRFPLVMLPNMITQLIQARVSMNRIKEFLKLPELDFSVDVELDRDADNAIEVDNGTFSWDSKEEKDILTNITMSVPRGKLVAVVGQVGAGKSSLVSAILGEMEKSEGSVRVNGTVSYVPQVAWVLNDSLKNNILFGAKHDKDFYREVISNCALVSDLKILPSGDATEIGEKGINLSGGQKQRVSLARAMYNKNDIYIFDDPLSAVDSHVGKHIFDNVIGKEGMIAKQTRLLVTHKLSVLPDTDFVIVMKDGKILEQGQYDDLMQREGELHRLVSNYEPEKESDTDSGVDEEIMLDEVIGAVEGAVEGARERAISGASRGSLVKRNGSMVSRKSSNVSKPRGSTAGSQKEGDKIIEEEKMEKGKISLGVYWTYIKYMGVLHFSIVFLCFIFQYSCMLGASFWLAHWSKYNDEREGNTDAENEAEGDDSMFYIGIYALLSIGQTLFVFGFVMSMLFAAIRASRGVHRLLFKNILRVPMAFFDTTPLGRILNRFSKDMNTIDEGLPRSLQSFINVLGSVIFTLILISYSIPYMLIVFLPVMVLYYLVQHLYVPTSRQLKRLESVSRSPIYNQFGETLLGLASVRAYKKQEDFIRYNEGLIDNNVRSYYMNMESNRWVAIRLEILGHVIIGSAAFFTVLQAESMDASAVGLSISYAMGMTQSLAWVVRMLSELETNVVSVERVNEYSGIQTEKELESEKTPAKDWPTRGDIQYKNVSVRYREGLPLVLSGIDMSITAGERIGIVGRTGAGKSSITLTLFRILELASGSIIIDGVDISKIGLHELRKKLAIIPQDPILFTGTLRENMDPFAEYNDGQLWGALESASLKEFISEQENKLDFEIQERGENMSVGQRQLVCLARALLSDCSIIVMDEATAAVDIETDEIIQTAIRQAFKGRTILTIAHRLNTILDYDRILVLDQGRIAEFDSALALKQKKGQFHSMLSDAGLLNAL